MWTDVREHESSLSSCHPYQIHIFLRQPHTSSLPYLQQNQIRPAPQNSSSWRACRHWHIHLHHSAVIFIRCIERLSRIGFQPGEELRDKSKIMRNDSFSIRCQEAHFRNIDRHRIEIVEVSPTVRRIKSLIHVLHLTHRNTRQQFDGLFRIFRVNGVDSHCICGITISAERSTFCIRHYRHFLRLTINQISRLRIISEQYQ